MDFYLMTEPQLGGSYQDLAWAAHAAEDAGLSGFARSDHYYWTGGDARPTTDAFTSLGGLAKETSRIRLSVLVSPITFRHPAVIAKSAATMDEMSNGRFDLGVGTGWMESEHEAYGLPFPSMKERFARLEEALAYLRAAFAGRPFEGTFYRLTADSLPRPAGLRIIVGGSGPERTPALAGRHADEYNQFAIHPSLLAPKIERMRAAASQAGRSPDQILVSLMGPAVIAKGDVQFQALMAQAANFRHISVQELTDRWAKNGVPMGSPGRALEALAAMSEAGVDRYYLQWLDLTDRRGIEAVVSAVARLQP